MTGESALLTTAEVAVAFAGFASVVTAFRRRDGEGWAAADVMRFRLMITSSLATVFFALLPFAIGFFGATERTVWSSSSSLLAIYLTLLLAAVGRRVVALASELALDPRISLSFVIVGFLVLALQALNGLGVVFDRELGPYFIGLLFLLTLSGFSFARMLPVGRRSVEE